MSTATLDAPAIAVSPALREEICIHPDADTADQLYWFKAWITNKDFADRRLALVVAPNSSIAAVNKAIWSELGDRWYCTRYEVA